MTANNLPLTVVINPKKATSSQFSETKLRNLLESLSTDVNKDYVNIKVLLEKVISGLPDSLTVESLLTLTAEITSSLTAVHPDYSILAANISNYYLNKSLPNKFSENIKIMRQYKNSTHKNSRPLVSETLYNIVMKNSDLLNSTIENSSNFNITYFGFKTLEKSYLLKIDSKPCETIQYMFMRVALGIHGEDIKSAIESYNMMTNKHFIHASPTLFNSGTELNYLSSCFLLATEDDSIDGIYKTLHKSALISKASGGIGIHISNIRPTGSYISGTNGQSSGIVPMLRVFNNTAKYVDQGGNKRPGAFAIYLEPWHADIFEFLDLRKNHGKEEYRARDLFYALWIPDLFMEKVKSGEDWCLFSETECPGLSDTYGDKFVKLYNQYESEGKYIKKVKAHTLWHAILVSQIETGNPFLLYKDASNEKSNQKNLGTIKSSNLCCEIMEYSSKEELAVCNLGSLGLPTFVETNNNNEASFNFEKLSYATKVLVKNLDKVIDVGLYPVPEAEYSNKKNRPLGVGVQGLADVFAIMRFPFGSREAKLLNIEIFETIYYSALEASVELAQLHKSAYLSYKGSPISKGLLQFDLWGHKPSNKYDWDELKQRISKYGVRNSLLVALMPTASTSQILGFNECFEPFTSNLYSRRVISGEFQVVNKYLIEDLIKLKIWNESIKNEIIRNNGSIQEIEAIPNDIKELYKTVWEMPQRDLIDMAADRAPFVDHSQSMNLFIKNTTMSKLTSMHFYAWKKGLKTGIYYLRTQAAASAIQFTLDPIVQQNKKRILEEAVDVDEKTKKFQKLDNVDIDDDDTTITCNIDYSGSCESCSG